MHAQFHVSSELLWRGNGNATESAAPLSVILAALKKCSRLRNLERGKEIHDQVIQSGLFTNRYIASSLIDMYRKCRSMVDAQKVFNKIPHPSVVHWNCLIQGYVENEQSDLALEIFRAMTQKCFPDARTYVSALTACAKLAKGGRSSSCHRWLDEGKEIHQQAIASSSCDIFVENKLIDLFSSCCSMEDARMVFDNMNRRDVVSWNAVIQGYVDNGGSDFALELFDGMKLDDGGCVPNARTYLAALTACASLASLRKDESGKWLEKGRSIHSGAAIERCCDMFVESALIYMYAQCGSMVDAHCVFEKMIRRDVVSWTALIQGYVETGNSELALELFEGMDCVPNARTYVAALMACAAVVATMKEDVKVEEWLSKGKDLHSQAIANRSCDNFVENALIRLYAQCGRMTDSRTIFDKMVDRNVVSWNSVLQGYVDNDEHESAMELFEAMDGSCARNERTYVAALTACGALAAKRNDKLWLGKGKLVHAETVTRGCCDAFVESSMVNLYTKCGEMVHAQCVFDNMFQRSVVAWTCLVKGFADVGDNELALELIAEMKERGVKLNSATFASALVACGNLMDAQTGKAFHVEIQSCGLEEDLCLATCLVEFYGKCGCVDVSRRVFDSIPVRDLWSWNTMLSVYSQQGDQDRALELFQSMEESGISPNEVTFTLLLSVCSHAGLAKQGKKYLQSMKSKFGVIPNLLHFNCVIDLLARSNHFEEALKMIREMPFEPNVMTWTAVLGGCRKWNNAKVGRLAYQSLLKLDEYDGVAYVLMANMYGSSDNTYEQEQHNWKT